MKKNLLIVFAKNKTRAKVKTRLAKTIGEDAAFEVYSRLYEITENESCKVANAAVEVHFSHTIDEKSWMHHSKYIQVEGNLGDKMKSAFKQGFDAGYENIIGIGADLPEITATIIDNAFLQFANNDFVFGPALDGGYYIVGVSGKKGLYIFDDKPWSSPELMDKTKEEINNKNVYREIGKETYFLLPILNDIDTIEDLKKSSLADEFPNFFTEVD